MADIVKDYSDIEKGVEKTLFERNAITNRRGNVVTPRKYHMTPEQIITGRKRWSESISGVSDEIKSKASTEFFNPYRANGGYYGGIQALFLLGANEWHSFGKVRGMMQEDMSMRQSPTNKRNSWEKFAGRSARMGAASTKDLMGRIVQNFRTLQRLGGLHPYGQKLKQLQTTVDIRRTEKGMYEFKLNTGSEKPFYDVSAFVTDKKKKALKGRAVKAEVIVSADAEVAV
jgi:hypothetical protein